MKNFLFLFSILFIGTSFKPTHQSKTFDFQFIKNDILLTEKSNQQLLEVAEYTKRFNAFNLSIEVPPNLDEDLNRGRLDELLVELDNLNLSVERILFYSSSQHLSDDLKNLENKSIIRLTVEEIVHDDFIISQNKKSLNEFQTLENKITKEVEIPKWAEPVIDYQKNTKEFSISNFAKSRLRTRDGSIIRIEPESFVYSDGSIVSEPITVITKYATTKNIAILEELTTIAGNEILESRGMMYINAFANGQQLQLAKPIKIEIEVQAIEENFQPFQGNRNVNTGIMNWTLDNETMSLINQALAKRYKYYKYEKISDEKRAEFIAYRNERIDLWKEKGYDKKRIKQRLKSAKKYARNREKSKKSYYKKRSLYTNNYDYDKRKRKDFDLVRKSSKSTANVITNKYKLGIPKYEFVEYEKVLPPGAKEGLFIISSSAMGWHNIDRIMRRFRAIGPPCDLIVKADKDENVKIVFDNFFTVLKGIPHKDGFIFKGVPEGASITVLSATKLDDGNIKFAQTKTKISTQTIYLSNYTTVSSERYTRIIEKMVI